MEVLNAALFGGNAVAGPAADLATFASQVRATLFQWREVHPAANIYVLLDGNRPVHADDPMHVNQIAKRPIQRQLTPVARQDLMSEPTLLPQLLCLHAAGENGPVDDDLVTSLLQCAWERRASANGSYVCAWLCGELLAGDLALRMAAAGTQVVLTQGRRSYLPLYEPHRFALAVALAPNAAAVRRWLEPLLHWAWLDAAGAWRNVSATTLQTGSHATASATPIELASAQDRVAIARQALVAMRKTELIPSVRPEAHIDALIKQAHALGLQHAEDVILFALNGVSLGATWHTHPAARNAIQRCSGEPEHRLADLLDALSDDQLDAIGDASGVIGSP